MEKKNVSSCPFKADIEPPCIYLNVCIYECNVRH